MNKAVIYHWWAEGEVGKYISEYADTPLPHQNLRVPIVLSIATLRAHNNYIPIYVLDCNEYETNWGHYPEILNFKVIKWKPHLHEHKKRNGWKNLSRVGDIRKFSNTIHEDEIIYCDSDVFWVKNVLPLLMSTDHFCFNHYNSGFYYYDKTAPKVNKFLDLFEAYVLIALNDKEMRKRINSTVSWDFWYYVLDEVVMQYMWKKTPEIVNKIPYHEHGLARDIRWPNVPVRDIKMFHTNGVDVTNKFHKVNAERKNSRGLTCLIFKELYEAICTTLPQSDIENIFTKEERDYYLPLQLELLSDDFVKRLQAVNVGYIDNIPLKDVIKPHYVANP